MGGLPVKNSSVDGMKFYAAESEPLKLYGNCQSDMGVYVRMPGDIAQSISDGVADRAMRSAGVRVRFKTNSERIGIKAVVKKYVQLPIQSAVATRGFDIYVNGKYRFSVTPQEDSNCYEYAEKVVDEGEKDVTVYFPYNSVIESVYIGIDEEASVSAADSYAVNVPIVFYGSSITQGFCVSRPGNVFSAIVSRDLDADYINLGCSGVCRGEFLMADYLAALKKSVLVCGYDHNEQSTEELGERHLPFYKRFREGDRKTPVLFISSPNVIYNGGEMRSRMKIVENTYKYAAENGDKNIHFIDGSEIYPDEIRFDCSADGIHPNDLGSYMIAKAVSEKLKEILFK